MLHRRASGRRPTRRGQGHTSLVEARPDGPDTSEPAAFNFEDWLPPEELAKLYHPEDGWHEVPDPGAATVSEPLRQAAQWWEDEPELKDFFDDEPAPSWVDDRPWADEPWPDDPVTTIPPPAAPMVVEQPVAPPPAAPTVVTAAAAETPVMDPPQPELDDVWAPEPGLPWDGEPAATAPPADGGDDWFPPPHDEPAPGPTGDTGRGSRPVQKFVFLNAATRYALDVPEHEMVEAAAETHSAAAAAAEEPVEDDVEPYMGGSEPVTTDGGLDGDGGLPVERKRHAHAARDGRRTRGSRKGRHVRTAPPAPEPEPVVVAEPPPPVAAAPADQKPRHPVSKRPIVVFGILAAVAAAGATAQLVLGGPSGSDASVVAGRPTTTLPRSTPPSTFVVLADPPETTPSLVVPITSAPVATTSTPPTTRPVRLTTTTHLPVTTLPNTVTTEPATTTTEPVPTTVFPTTTRPPTTTTTAPTTTSTTTTTTTQPPTTTTLAP